jgi:hypothetical protein
MSGKRKRVVVSLQIKLDAIKRMDQGETIKKVASDLGHHTCRSFVAAKKRGTAIKQKTVKDFLMKV